MKKLILSALVIGAASQAAGCIIVSDDTDTGDAQVTWSLLSADANGNSIPAGCPAGATSAIIYAQLDGVDDPPYIDKYNCSAGAGLAADLPSGQYLVWVRLTDDSENTLYAESGSLVTQIANDATTPVNHSIFVDHAFYQLSWRLNPPGGSNFQCSQVVGERGVSIAGTAAGGGLIDEIIDCEEGITPNIATTTPWPSMVGGAGAQYTMSITLLNQTNDVIGTADTLPASPDRALNYGNEFEDIGIVDIALE